MPRSKARSSNTRKTEAPLTAEPSTTTFELVCVCGQKHAGQRRRRHQQILCNDCGAALFVLPIDCYPTPTVKVSPSTKRPAGQRFAKSLANAGSRAGDSIARFVLRCWDAFCWVFSPIKLIAYAVIALVALTGWYVSYQKALTQAETDVVAQAEAGYDALQTQDYPSASEAFTVAAEAVRLLGRTDEPSRRIEQAARESTVLANLSTTSIIELVEDVDRAGVSATNTWKRPEQLSMRDTWIAFDASVEKRRGHIGVPLPIEVGRPPRQLLLRADAPAFDDVPLDDGPITLTFAAQVKTVRRSTSTWEVILDPDTLFLWETPGLYPELGFPVDPVWNTANSIRERLTQQRLWQGGEALPEDDEATVPEETTDADANQETS